MEFLKLSHSLWHSKDDAMQQALQIIFGALTRTAATHHHKFEHDACDDIASIQVGQSDGNPSFTG